MSKFSIDWSIEALEKSKAISDAIYEQWGISSVLEFRNKLTDLIKLLAENKDLCPKSKKLSFRKCVVTKQTSLIYFVEKKIIKIITLIDNRSSHNY